MANPGKNKLLRFVRLFVGGMDLSGDSRTFANLGNAFNFVDFTGWNETIKKGLPDMVRTMGIKGYQAFINDDTAGAFTLLKEPASGLELSLLFGGNAEPVYGDLAYLLAGVQMASDTAFDAGAGVFQTDFLPESGISQENPFGNVLFNNALTVATNGTSIDNLVASTNGLHANLHITATSSGNFAFKVQHSTDDAIFTDLVSFTITGGTLVSEHVTVTGTVNRYLRGLATRTGGTCTAVMVAARN